MRLLSAVVLVVAGSVTMNPSLAQSPMPWSFVPSIVVVGAPQDPRVAMEKASGGGARQADLVGKLLQRGARQLARAGAGLGLPPPRLEALPVPEAALQQMSRTVLQGGAPPQPIPDELQQLPGNLVIVLGNSDFVSLSTTLFAARSKRVD